MAPQTQTQNEHIKDRSVLWDQYVKEAEIFDQELIGELSGDLDVLLIFAGLFSAINTAFIIESYHDLQPDPADATNLLLRTIAYNINNSSFKPIDLLPEPFVVPLDAVIVNSLYFASLSCSLITAFGAVLAKQWLIEYGRNGKKRRSAYDRAHRRHIKYLGMQKYGGEVVVHILGTLLQLSLFLFLSGIIKWLWTINTVVALVVIAGAGIIFMFYIATTIMSILDHSSPFSTRLSATVRNFSPALRHPTEFTSSQDGRCMAWLRDHATTFQSIAAVANSASLLPAKARTKHGLDADRMGPDVLRSVISDNAIPNGFFDGTLHHTLRTLSAVLPGNARSQHFPLVAEELYSILRPAILRDESLGISIVRILDSASGNMVQTIGSSQEGLTSYLSISTLSTAQIHAGLSLLYLHYIGPAHIESLRQAYRSAIAISETPEQSTWQWKVAEALKKTKRLGIGAVEKDSVLQKFQEKWPLVFLEPGSTFEVLPRPRWTIDSIRRGMWLSPFEEHGGPNSSSNDGLLVLMEYALNCASEQRKGDDFHDKSLDPEAVLGEFITGSWDMTEILLLAIEEIARYPIYYPALVSSNHRLVLMPLLWLTYVPANSFTTSTPEGLKKTKELARYAKILWLTIMHGWDLGLGWSSMERITPYVEGMGLFLDRASPTELLVVGRNLPDDARNYKTILKKFSDTSTSLGADQKVVKRLESCVKALARAFGIDVDGVEEGRTSKDSLY